MSGSFLNPVQVTKDNYLQCNNAVLNILRWCMSTIEETISELKVKIIETLGLLDVTPEDIKDDEPLVGGDTGIDSIDVLELVMMIEKDYGVKIESKELGAKVFASVRALATYLLQAKKAGA